ncbi:MAG: hypothetical protein BWZ08_02311 [candidate division BRC1 bacterium ADurb.BinA292]|mgnify:CR=1 FL=1|nr:MAG: hypothetical protein BWZ08_02311 [candidate division BRC1 bacterium ADurb.BinA292]
MLTTYRIHFRIAPWTPDLPEGHGELTVRALGEAEAIETFTYRMAGTLEQIEITCVQAIETTQEVAPCTESL